MNPFFNNLNIFWPQKSNLWKTSRKSPFANNSQQEGKIKHSPCTILRVWTKSEIFENVIKDFEILYGKLTFSQLLLNISGIFVSSPKDNTFLKQFSDATEEVSNTARQAAQSPIISLWIMQRIQIGIIFFLIMSPDKLLKPLNSGKVGKR